jgi:DNA helicase-4
MTVYLTQKKNKVIKNRDELEKAYLGFVNKLNNDRYLSKRDFFRWTTQSKSVKKLVNEYVYFKDRINKWAEKGGFFSTQLQNYVDHFSVDKSLEKKIRSLKNIFDKGQDIVETRNENFIKNEIRDFSVFFNKLGNNDLTNNHKRAIITDEANNLVISAAGSEEKAVIVGKIDYLLRKNLVNPSELLVLTSKDFGKFELEKLINKYLEFPVEVKTFQELAADIILKTEGTVPNVAEISINPQILENDIEGFLKKKTQEISFLNQMNRYILFYLKTVEYIDRIKSEEDYQRYLSRVELKTLNGDRVNNMAQMEIANYLLLNGIDYEYKKEYDLNSDESRSYSPDFYLSNYNTWIEYFKINENNEPSFGLDKKNYLKDIDWKRKKHLESYTDLVETYEFEKDRGTLLENLREKLDVRGVKFKKAEPSEVYTKLENLGSMKELVGLFTKFLNLYESSELAIDELRDKISGNLYSRRYFAFLEIFELIYEDYSSHFKDKINVNRLFSKATNHILTREFESPYRYIILNNFQDISQSKFKLLRSLVDSEKTLFCLGDDWQSICSLFGADLSIMTGFDRYFEPVAVTILDKSFRFNNTICDFTSNFVSKNPNQYQKDIKGLEKIEGEVNLIWYEDLHQALEETIFRIREREKGSILVIGRYDEGDYVDLDFDVIRVGNLLEDPDLELEYCKAIESRGKVADYVIIACMRSGFQSFPSEIEDDPILNLVRVRKETYPYAEERRLFYVAATRARKGVYILADRVNPSPFITEIRDEEYEFQESGNPP